MRVAEDKRKDRKGVMSRLLAVRPFKNTVVVLTLRRQIDHFKFDFNDIQLPVVFCDSIAA